MSEQPKQIGLTEDGRPIYAWPAQAAQPPACNHQAPALAAKSSGGAAKWIGLSVAAVFIAVAISISLVSVAIAAVCLTVCVLILRDVWTSMRKDR